MDGWMDGRMHAWMDGWMLGWTDGWMNGWTATFDWPLFWEPFWPLLQVSTRKSITWGTDQWAK